MWTKKAPAVQRLRVQRGMMRRLLLSQILADINGDGIYSAADLTALARMLEAQQGTQTADADENGAPVDTGAELNADAQDTVQTEDGGAPVEPAPAVDDVPETVEEPATGEVPQTEAGEQAA